MKLALLGHGQMARVVEAQARAAGHDLAAVISSRNAADAVRLLPGHTVAIDFSVPAAVREHATSAGTRASAVAMSACPLGRRIKCETRPLRVTERGAT